MTDLTRIERPPQQASTDVPPLLILLHGYGSHEHDLMGLADYVVDDAAGLDAIEADIRKQVLRCAPGANAVTKEIALATPEEKTFFHELAHAGHERIKGKLTPGQDPFQEITAELCAQALCRLVGKSGEKHFGNSARYISNYAEKAGITPHAACLKVLSDTEKVLNQIFLNN